MTRTPLVSLERVSKRFSRRVDLAGRIANMFGASNRDQTVHAVDEISLTIAPGEVVGLVGESGCGKSTAGRVVAGVHAATEGEVRWLGTPVNSLDDAGRRAYTLGVQMIFQDPMASLNPRMRAGDIIGEAPVVHGLVRPNDQRDAVASALRRVGLDPDYARRYPHQFSGGQRARIGIARALAVNPRLLVCDESVAALDVSVQAQVINLFMDLREQLDLAYLFISHDLSVVRHIASRVAIMYLGRIVEIGTSEALFEAPAHPYTRALLENVPRLDLRKRIFPSIRGEIPSPLDPPSGCHFHPRCPLAGARCSREAPRLIPASHGGAMACHINDGGTD